MPSHFNRSALVRQLAPWLPTPPEPSRQDLPERLGQWLNVADAIALHSAHVGIAALGTAAKRARPAPSAVAQAPSPPHTSAPALEAELHRVRDTLARGITQRGARHRPDPNDLDTEFNLLLQHALAQQQRMELAVHALRQHARQVLNSAAQGADHTHSAPLAQLAALDTVLEQLLGGREQQLLGGLSTLCKARFAQLRQASQAQTQTGAAADADAAADAASVANTTATSPHPGLAALAQFRTELEHTQLAELELRLQPVAGLIDALRHAH